MNIRKLNALETKKLEAEELLAELDYDVSCVSMESLTKLIEGLEAEIDGGWSLVLSNLEVPLRRGAYGVDNEGKSRKRKPPPSEISCEHGNPSSRVCIPRHWNLSTCLLSSPVGCRAWRDLA